MKSHSISESEFREAAALVRLSMLATLPDETEESFSDAFYEKIAQLKEDQTKREKRHQIGKRILAAMVALFISFTILLTFNTEVRATVITWFKKVYDTYTVYWFRGEATSKLPEFTIVDIPEAFQCVYDETLTHSRSMLYQNKANPSEILSFRYSSLQSDAPLVVEFTQSNYSVEEVCIGELTGELYISQEPDESHALVWIDEYNNVVFTLTFLGDPTVMLHIAESVKLVK